MLARTESLVTSAAACAILMAAFALMRASVGGRLLDACMTQRAAARRLDAMTPAQKRAHLLVTLTLDSLFPLAYGALLAGVALRSGGANPLLAAPAAAAIAADYGENLVQIAALAGWRAPLAAKTALTPLKFALTGAALALALGLLARGLLAAG